MYERHTKKEAFIKYYTFFVLKENISYFWHFNNEIIWQAKKKCITKPLTR